MYIANSRYVNMIQRIDTLHRRIDRIDRALVVEFGPTKAAGEGPRDSVPLVDVVEQILDHLGVEIVGRSPRRPACSLKPKDD